MGGELSSPLGAEETVAMEEAERGRGWGW